jgi:tetratricopeptide (TPR) repeat protein
MSNLSVSEVYDDFRTNYQLEPDFTIDFHNKNSIFFNNYKSFTDDIELGLYIELVGLYIQALYTKNRFNIVIDEADNYLKIIDYTIENLKAYQLKTQCQWYYDIEFVKAMAYYRLQDYETSEILFKELVSVNPQNENFSIWLHHAKFHRRSKLMYMVYIVCGVFVFSALISKTVVPFFIRISLLIIGFTAIICMSLYEMQVKRSFRKIRKP